MSVGRDHDQALLHIKDGAGIDVPIVLADGVGDRIHLAMLSAASSSSASSSEGGASPVTSSDHTVIEFSRLLPYCVVSATSMASRPRPITTRPMRGTLCRASKVYHRSPR